MLNKIKKALKLDWKTLNLILSDMSKRSKRNKIDLFKDMYDMYKNEGYTWLNYYTYNFDRNKSLEYRKSFLSEYRDNGYIYNHCDNQDNLHYLRDKGDFALKYKDFLGREIIDIRHANEEEFLTFLNKHKVVFAKAPSNCGGKGVVRVKEEEVNKESIYDELKTDGLFVIEEALVQHEEMSKLSLNSVNTIRTATAINSKGEVKILYMVLRTSVSDSYLDNGSQGGVWTILSEDGEIVRPMFTNLPKELVTEVNPGNGFKYRGFKVPMVDELKKLVIDAANVLPDLRYVGWDIAITPNGPVIIEGNDDPSVELYQAYVHLDEPRGKVKEMEEALDIKLR